MLSYSIAIYLKCHLWQKDSNLEAVITITGNLSRGCFGQHDAIKIGLAVSCFIFWSTFQKRQICGNV